MKTLNHLKYFSCLIILLTIFFTSCKKFVTIPPPKTQVESSLVFENDQAAISAVVGLYSQIMLSSLSIANGGATLYPALSADELYNTSPNTDYDAFRTDQIQFVSSTGLTRLWTFGYHNIYQANAVLEGLAQSTSLSDSLKNQLKGEMLVVRALNYFYLVNLFGNLPLVTSTDFQTNQSLPRSSVADVYNLMVADLQAAKNLLPVSYPSAGRVRPNKWAATTLLARVYLYMQNWSQAEAEATEVINSGTYTLVSNLNNVFLTASTEAIWQISPVSSSINTAEGNQFIPSSATAKPVFALTSYLLNAFEATDQRKSSWLKFNTITGQAYYYPYKYKVRTGAPPYTEYYMVLRLAELFLIRAEARAQQNNITGAQDDLNIIRSRAGLPNTAANTQPLLLNAIAQENRIEFMTEWGHRWLDLKRTGLADAVLQPIKSPTWQSTDTLYPILQYELDTNPFLTQNPGY